ncbi:MAG TPA: 4-hydroxy-tetrahydrodipicolinate reductase [Streptosporangiaceae bacterium]|nr:4-hydroxy-tetrahydrodipicolinate reductase [Streptosporangiaceae bacterium]
MIKVGVLGARGRMGSLVAQTVLAADDLDLVAEVDLGDSRDALKACDVIVDFTSPAAVMDNLRWCLVVGRDVVVGTSGFDAARLAEAADLVAGTPDPPRILVVPNFSVGAVLMMRFAEQAAPFFESAEIIELHHANKVDAPSGTAARTAAMIHAARAAAALGPVPDATTTQSPGARGAIVDDIHVHSVRLPGLVAHQEVLLGGTGETLTIRHDSLDRASFMPGVLRAIRGLATLPPGLTVGLDSLLGL